MEEKKIVNSEVRSNAGGSEQNKQTKTKNETAKTQRQLCPLPANNSAYQQTSSHYTHTKKKKQTKKIGMPCRGELTERNQREYKSDVYTSP
jgi:hypothetical protein